MFKVENERLTGAYIAKNENALYQEMVSLSYARKANDTSEIELYRNDYNKLSPMARFYIAMLPVVEKTWSDWMQPDGFPRSQQFFVVKDGNKFYIVDMQGYDYCRYVGVLDNFNEPIVEEDEEIDYVSDIVERGFGLSRMGDQAILESVVSNLTHDLAAEGFCKKDTLIILQAFLDHAFDNVCETTSQYLFTKE